MWITVIEQLGGDDQSGEKVIPKEGDGYCEGGEEDGHAYRLRVHKAFE